MPGSGWSSRQLATESRPSDGVTRCLVRMAKLEHKADERGWTVVYRRH